MRSRLKRMNPDSNQLLSNLEVLFRPHHERSWQSIQRPSQLSVLSSLPHESQYSLIGAGLSDRSRMGKITAEIVMQTHHSASSDVRYLPNALLRYHMDQNTKSIVFEITAKEGPLPELPVDMRGWEGRHPTCLTYTARGSQLKEFLDLVMNQKIEPPVRSTIEKNPTVSDVPKIKLGR
jgi:hypothetical protein